MCFALGALHIRHIRYTRSGTHKNLFAAVSIGSLCMRVPFFPQYHPSDLYATRTDMWTCARTTHCTTYAVLYVCIIVYANQLELNASRRCCVCVLYASVIQVTGALLVHVFVCIGTSVARRTFRTAFKAQTNRASVKCTVTTFNYIQYVFGVVLPLRCFLHVCVWRRNDA